MTTAENKTDPTHTISHGPQKLVADQDNQLIGRALGDIRLFHIANTAFLKI